MKKIVLRTVSLVLAVLFLLFGTINVSALNFNGTSSAGGDGSSTTASSGGYAIPNMIANNSNRAVGYRFTVINNAGGAVTSSIDVFRYSTYTADGIFYAGYQKFDTKLCKTELKACYTSRAFSTSGTTAGVCHDSDMGLTLPNDTTGIEGWSTDANLGVVLKGLWGYSVSTLENNAWAILIEPIFPIKLQSVYHALTPTEIAVYGASKFGSGSNGNSSSNANSFGFIANYSNRYYPNSLRLTSTYVGLAAAENLTSRTTFASIINNGYGCAIAYANLLSYKPEIVRWTYYQNSYDGFYVYIYTLRTASLSVPTWTDLGGQDDLIWHSATSQGNTIRGQYYNWAVYIPRSSHKNEIGHYTTHFYAYAANGTSVSAGGGYQPPNVTAKTIKQTDADGFNVYVNTVAATNLSIPTWTDSGGQDDLIWHQAIKETNVVDGVTYAWKLYVKFADHKNELGKYILHFYVNNEYSEGLCAATDSFTPLAKAQLKVDCCEVWPGEVSQRNNNHYGISYGSTFDDYAYGHGYPMLGDKVWYAVHFPKEMKNYYVRQTVWLEDGSSVSRNVYSNDNEWYDLSLSPETVDSKRESYTVKARADLLNDDGTVDTEGEVYTFYIPIAPTLNAEKVTAKSITGDVQAVGTPNNCNGKVYYGQRIYAEYTVISENEWTSQNHIRGAAYEWMDGWTRISPYNPETGDADLYEDNVSISASKPFSKQSTLGLYTVPNNIQSGESKIPFLVWTHWVKDIERTEKLTWINIPISISDVELAEIRLIDSNGYYVDEKHLIAGQRLTPRYVYKNNTDCTVYVNGYSLGEKQIDGIFSIPAGKSISVDGIAFTVPDENEIDIWGGVFLEGAGIHNTEYESNGSNNEMTLHCKISLPLKIVPIMPNADYREDTEVLSSFWVVNESKNDYIPSDKVGLKFTVTDTKNKVLYENTISNIVVPGDDKNLYFIKWKVPKGLNKSKVKITSSVVWDSSLYNTVDSEYATCLYDKFTTPDTQFEKKKPDGFNVPAVPETDRQYATWWQYAFEDGKIVKKEYGICSYTDENENLTPASTANATLKDGVYTMPSGYGVQTAITDRTANVIGYISPDKSAYTNAQYNLASFPEFKYILGKNACKTLEKADAVWRFPDNDGYGNIHFVPLYFPDGKYIAKITKSDFWTPAGMLMSTGTTKPIIIKDSVYDNWYVSHK